MLYRCLPIAAFALLTACGGGGESQVPSPIVTTPPRDTTLTLRITDAPVDYASEVVIQFSGVAIKPENGEEQNFEFEEAKSIDLLALQGSNSAILLDDQIIDSGSYEWIRLAVNAEQGVRDSYMITDGQEIELRIPSGGETGLGHLDEEQNVIDPLTTALVKFEETDGGATAYNFEFGFIVPGDYSLAFTCSNDDPEIDEREVYSTETLDPPSEDGQSVVTFYGDGANTYSVTVTANESTIQNIELPDL